MSIVEPCFHGPNFAHFSRFPTTKSKPQNFNPNPVSSKSSPTSQFFLRAKLLISQRGNGGRLFGLLGTMDGASEDDYKGEVERDGVLEQEQSPLVGGSSRFLSPALRTGLEVSLNRLSKWLVAALFTAVILWRHDAEALWAAMGSVLNSALSVALKRILNQERPTSARSSGPGMPSSHGQSIFYSVIFLIWSLIEWLGVDALSLIFGTLVLAFGSYLSWLRVSQQYHTSSQVAVGAAVGSGFAFLWLWFWKLFVVHEFASYLWVRVIVLLGAAICCLGFLLYIIKHWLREHQ